MGLMGVINAVGGPRAIGGVVRGVTDAIQPNATRRLELGHEGIGRALDAHMAEFVQAEATAFDRFVNGLNRLPRPALALGTMVLFAYAMAEPEGFALRMDGLGHIPEPLWWLLGAIVSFYFGAREAHYLRMRRPASHRSAEPATDAPPASPGQPLPGHDNPALAEWLSAR
ncbi:holin family protein [Halodurantibacterium flavum]|uniref:Holin family protein n=1 Tax=Halodurantibacterium flavum TaxID=1382802 RepID=A0ABW4S3Y5_9RHOB